MAGIISQIVGTITQNLMGSLIFLGIGFLIGLAWRFMEYGI